MYHATPIFLRAANPIGLLALILVVGAALALMQPAHAEAKQEKATQAPHLVSKKRPVRLRSSRSSSDETRTQRERRLLRECRGMPNAGACLGYARPWKFRRTAPGKAEK